MLCPYHSQNDGAALTLASNFHKKDTLPRVKDRWLAPQTDAIIGHPGHVLERMVVYPWYR